MKSAIKRHFSKNKISHNERLYLKNVKLYILHYPLLVQSFGIYFFKQLVNATRSCREKKFFFSKVNHRLFNSKIRE